VTPQTHPISGQPSSPELKARIFDFMERSNKLLEHDWAEYNPPMGSFQVDPTTDQMVGMTWSTDLVEEEMLVYFATIQRPMLWVEKDEKLYVPKMIEAIRVEHPSLTMTTCAAMTARWKKEWTDRLYIGIKSSTTPIADPVDGWQLTKVQSFRVGMPFPSDPEFDDVPMQQDYDFARSYLYGFVWHNDMDKTKDYRDASDLMKLHYRRCAEIRVWAGLNLILRPMRDYFVWAREQGEDF
jgi:hypothetical protein